MKATSFAYPLLALRFFRAEHTAECERRAPAARRILRCRPARSRSRVELGLILCASKHALREGGIDG